MKVLFCGDIVGRSGREAVIKNVPRLRRELGLDFVVVNGENAAAGFGITAKICAELHDAGVDCITTGNHVWDQREIIPYIAQDKRLLRPINFPPGTPGWGANLFETRARPEDRRHQRHVPAVHGSRSTIRSAPSMPRSPSTRSAARRTSSWSTCTARRPARSSRWAITATAASRPCWARTATSRPPTRWVLPGGTAYQTDVGMCGDYDSVIGMKKEVAVLRFIKKMPGERLSPAEGEGTLCAALVETDDKTGLARSVRPIRIGGRLPPTA